MKQVCKLLTLLIIILTTVFASVQEAKAEGAIFLIDRTGSMNTERVVTGNTRCEDARTVATVDVNSFFNMFPTGQGAVWTFADDGWINVTGGFVDSATCINAVNGLAPNGCAGLSPLAEAMCGAADALIANFPTSSRFLYVSSDGGENNSDGQCAGPDATGRPYPPDSWQAKVIEKMLITGTVNVRYWGALAKSSNPYDSETGLPNTSQVSDKDFFSDLADTTGGSFTYYYDDHIKPSLPTLTQWGVIILLALMLLSGIIIIRRRKALVRS